MNKGEKMNTQVDLSNETVTSARTEEIKKEEKTRKFVKQAKRDRHNDVLGQRRLNGQRIHQKTAEFHESKDARKKEHKRRQIKIARENRERVEQSTLF